MFRRLSVIMLVLAAVSCGPPEIHLIPDGYRGDVYILPGVPSGDVPRREGRAKVFVVPPTGILATQDHPSEGWHTTKYYYVYASGNRTELEYEPSTMPKTPANLSDQRKIAWFARGIGTIRSRDLPCTIKFMQYYVGTPAHLLSRTVDEANAQQLAVEEFVRKNRACAEP